MQISAILCFATCDWFCPTGKGKFLAHLWGAYAILSAVRRQACAVCIHHNYQK